MSFRVVQITETFKYPVGKAWGPYVEECDAQARLATLRSFQGDGVIENGEFGTPCGLQRVDAGGGGGGVLAYA